MDKNLAEDDSPFWFTLAMEYYRTEGADDSREKISELVDRSIAYYEEKNIPWQDHCHPYFVYNLRETGHDAGFESTMTQCHKQFEERLKVNYLCPCTWYGMVLYTIIDGRYEEAVQRADQWFTDGGSTSFLEWEPIFSLLADQPEFEAFLARNAEQMARQQQIYLSGTERIKGP